MASSSGTGTDKFTPHIITIQTGENIVQKILDFSQSVGDSIFILSASGTITRAEILQPHSPQGIKIFEGHFVILQLNGSHAYEENTGGKVWVLSVNFSNFEAECYGGQIAGSLIAGSTTYVGVGVLKRDRPRVDNVRSSQREPGSTSRSRRREPVSTSRSRRRELGSTSGSRPPEPGPTLVPSRPEPGFMSRSRRLELGSTSGSQLPEPSPAFVSNPPELNSTFAPHRPGPGSISGWHHLGPGSTSGWHRPESGSTSVPDCAEPFAPDRIPRNYPSD